jgi:GntR family transcriptional regulator
VLDKMLSARPLYRRVRDALAARISKGEWRPTAAIPNEDDLAREFGVSPGTMRKALDLLESERLVTRRQGRGTFVNDQSSGELSQRFINVRTPNGMRILGDVSAVEITGGKANAMECTRLSLQTTDDVHRMRRVRVIDNKPFMLEEASMPVALFPDLQDTSGSAHRIMSLAQAAGILLGKAEERISISVASEEVAAALGVARGASLALLDRVLRAIDGRPVEWRVAMCDLAHNYYLASMD